MNLSRSIFTGIFVLVFLASKLSAAIGLDDANHETEASTVSLEDGVSFDVATGKAAPVTSASETGQESGSADHTGTGDLVSDTTLSEDELDMMAESVPFYAPYEVKEGRGGSGENFVPFSVIEPDTREVVVNTTEFPARAVVYISFVGSADQLTYGCSGAMISKDVVLTAGHCVHTGGPSGKWHKDFLIFPGRNGAVKPFGSCSVKRLYSIRGWLNEADSNKQRLYDLGAMELDCDVGDQTGWFDLMTIADTAEDKATTIRGYPCDKAPSGKQWISKDKIRDLVDRKVFYQNDTFGCMSGAPVLSDDGNRVFAVHTNGLHNGEPWTSNNAGTRLTETRIENLREWVGE